MSESSTRLPPRSSGLSFHARALRTVRGLGGLAALAALTVGMAGCPGPGDDDDTVTSVSCDSNGCCTSGYDYNNNYCQGQTDSGGTATTIDVDGGTVWSDGGVVGDGGGSVDGAADGGPVTTDASVSCTGFANCSVGEACNGGVCTACGGSNGPCPCTTDSQCGAGLECVQNACTPAANACHYQTDCASGDVCDDGQCVSACTTSCAVGTCAKGACTPPAPTGTSCSDDTACSGASPFCVDGHCAPACGGDGGTCASGFTCNQGACVASTGPAVECTQSSQCSAAGQSCVHNLCKFLCATSADCVSHDSRFTACASDGVCRTPEEAAPKCTTQSDCAPGQDCIDNVCE